MWNGTQTFGEHRPISVPKLCQRDVLIAAVRAQPSSGRRVDHGPTCRLQRAVARAEKIGHTDPGARHLHQAQGAKRRRQTAP